MPKGQLAAIAVEIEKWKAVEAKKRIDAGRANSHASRRGELAVEDLPQPSAKASDEAGAMLGVSGRSVRDAKFVEQNDPELAGSPLRLSGTSVALIGPSRGLKPRFLPLAPNLNLKLSNQRSDDQ